MTERMNKKSINKNENRILLLVLFAALGVGFIVSAANLWLGDLNQDEGWYLYAANQVADGKLPYRDFAFSQPPVMPFVYALVARLVDAQGVAGGRFFTAILGVLSALLAAGLAWRASPAGWKPHGALLTLILVLCNVYHSYFTTVVKTYSLCSLFLVGGLLTLSFITNQCGWRKAFIAGVLLALAAGTRMSAGAALPVMGLYLLFNRKPLGDKPWVAFGVGGGLSLLGIFLPFAMMAPDGFRFFVFDYHTLRSSGTFLSSLVYKAGFISRFVQGYLVLTFLLLAVIVFAWLKPVGTGKKGETGGRKGFIAGLWGVGVLISLVHLSAPFPYDDYQVFVYPVLCAALSIGLCAWCALRIDAPASAARWRRWLIFVTFFMSVAASFSSPLNQAWFILGRDRIWWNFKEEPDVAKLRRIGRWLADRCEPDEFLLTEDIYVAVEAGLSVPPGMEMGIFCYFPEWDRERAERIRVLNKEMLIDLLRAGAAAYAAVSEYGFSVQSPEVARLPEEEKAALEKMLDVYYREATSVPHFGQGHTTLRLLRRRDDEPTKNTK